MSQAGVVSPNFSVLGNWRTTLSVFFQSLRRLPLLTEEVFQLGDFDPNIDWNGMTVTGMSIYRARYLKIWKFIWFSVDFGATLAAPLTTNILITIPGTAPENVGASTTVNYQGGGYMCQNAGAWECGIWWTQANDNRVRFARNQLALNFGAGSCRIVANGFIEVK